MYRRVAQMTKQHILCGLDESASECKMIYLWNSNDKVVVVQEWAAQGWSLLDSIVNGWNSASNSRLLKRDLQQRGDPGSITLLGKKQEKGGQRREAVCIRQIRSFD